MGIIQLDSTKSSHPLIDIEPVQFLPIAQHLRDIMEQIFVMLDKEHNNALANKKLESYLWALVSDTFYQFVNRQKQKEQPTNNAKPDEIRKKIIAARDEMLRDFSKESLDLDYLAKFAGMNRTKFQQAFKDIFNISFYKYYQEARFNEALRLLEFEQHTTTSVASAIGYKNVGYFIKEFQKRFGMTPNEYRTKNVK
jgi:AraC-like DNA-binding protein